MKILKLRIKMFFLPHCRNIWNCIYRHYFNHYNNFFAVDYREMYCWYGQRGAKIN